MLLKGWEQRPQAVELLALVLVLLLYQHGQADQAKTLPGLGNVVLVVLANSVLGLLERCSTEL